MAMSIMMARTRPPKSIFLSVYHHRRFFNTESTWTASLELGSCYIPKPRGLPRDAHFVCPSKNVFGVADGCFGDSVYPKILMFNALMIVGREEPRGYLWPLNIFEKAASMTKEKGESTACILGLERRDIIAANVGNSGFLVIRNGEVAYRSPMLLHRLHSPIFLSNYCGQSIEVMSVPVEDGDVIVAATDGLFHNLFEDAILNVTNDGKRHNLNPSTVSANLAEAAKLTSQNEMCDTPFQKARRQTGTVGCRMFGGKEDDITVIVGNVISR